MSVRQFRAAVDVMPSSNPSLYGSIIALAAEHKPAAVLDVGPGFGKYGLAMREFVRPDRLDAVEAELRYVGQFPWLGLVYDRLWVENVADWPRARFEPYDVVLMIDVLEHLDHDVGEQLLARIPGRVVVCTPAAFFQNPEHVEYPSEKHRSHWSTLQIAAVRELDADDVYASSIGGVLVRTTPL